MQQTVQKPTTLAIRGVNIQGQRSILAMATTLESMRWFGPAVLDAKTCRLSTGATVNEAKGPTQLVERLPDSLGPTPRGGLASDNVKVQARCSLCGIYATCQLDKGTGERICATCATIEVTP